MLQHHSLNTNPSAPHPQQQWSTWRDSYISKTYCCLMSKSGWQQSMTGWLYSQSGGHKSKSGWQLSMSGWLYSQSGGMQCKSRWLQRMSGWKQFMARWNLSKYDCSLSQGYCNLNQEDCSHLCQEAGDIYVRKTNCHQSQGDCNLSQKDCSLS